MRPSPFAGRRSATAVLIIANVVAFLIECVFYGYPPRFSSTDYLALNWNGLLHGYLWQLISFQFLHAGIFHLLCNCFVLYMFGRELESVLGLKRFLILYFGSGVMGGLLQWLAGGLAASVLVSSPWARAFLMPTVGASAGTFGLVAAYAALYPERMLTFLVLFVLPVSIRAKYLLGISAGMALFGIVFPGDHLADFAHLGGMAAGWLFARYALDWEWRWPHFRIPRWPLRQRVRVLPSKPGPRRSREVPDADLPPEDFLSKEVDPILDKIYAHGIQSLTERERRILETAREKMGRR